MAFGSKRTQAAGPVDNKSADLWTAERMAKAAESGRLADEARAEAERIRNGGR